MGAESAGENKIAVVQLNFIMFYTCNEVSRVTTAMKDVPSGWLIKNSFSGKRVFSLV